MDKISELLGLSKLGCVLLKTSENISDENFYYFTGLDKSSGLNAFLILNKNRTPLVLANTLEYGALKNNKNFRTVKFDSLKELEGLTKKYTAKNVGINYTKTSVSSMRWMRKILKNRKFADVSRHLGKTRETKTPGEISKIREACGITSEIFDSIPDMVKAGMREIDIRGKIDDVARRNGAVFSFPPIIASGPGSSVPHHVTGARKIRRGEILLVDTGVAFENYCSDMTRTFFVGRAPESVKGVYGIVKKAQDESIAMIKDGVKSKDVFLAANRILKKELKQPLIHSLGHGLGMNVHDFPEGISEKAKYALRENMVLAIEPAYYGREYGVRVEDNLVVRKNSAGMMSKSPKEITEI
jgi:Xaa-Pro aminopeptidase